MLRPCAHGRIYLWMCKPDCCGELRMQIVFKYSFSLNIQPSFTILKLTPNVLGIPQYLKKKSRKAKAHFAFYPNLVYIWLYLLEAPNFIRKPRIVYYCDVKILGKKYFIFFNAKLTKEVNDKGRAIILGMKKIIHVCVSSERFGEKKSLLAVNFR